MSVDVEEWNWMGRKNNTWGIIFVRLCQKYYFNYEPLKCSWRCSVWEEVSFKWVTQAKLKTQMFMMRHEEDEERMRETSNVLRQGKSSSHSLVFYYIRLLLFDGTLTENDFLIKASWGLNQKKMKIQPVSPSVQKEAGNGGTPTVSTAHHNEERRRWSSRKEEETSSSSPPVSSWLELAPK